MSRPMFVEPIDVSNEVYLDFIANQESQDIHGVGNWWMEVIQRAAKQERQTGHEMPWSKTHNDFRLRPNELTIWAGYRGHMKSFVTGQLAAWLAKEVRVGIASFEMPPLDTIWRMVCQCAGTVDPSMEWAESWLVAMDPMIRIYDQNTALTPERVLAVIHHFAHVLGCEHVFIDSLMKCGIPTDDYTAQKTFVDQLCVAAKRYGIHIHLVAHLRKPNSRSGALPNSDDVAGGSDITNLADNVVIVWNDKEVMELRAKHRAGVPMDPEELEAVSKRTHILKLDKQRRGADQVAWSFWFHDRSLQFLPENRSQPVDWLQGTTMQRLALHTGSMANDIPTWKKEVA